MSPRSSSDPTSDRIIAAATAEFARYGIAGARVERIAKAARTGKERVYAYFRSKEELYRFVAGRELAAMAEAVQLDPTDLPGYAGRIHDHAIHHPERHRLMMWGQLELPAGETPPDDPLQESLRRKIEQLRNAQDAGHLDPAWEPEDILVFVSQLALSWVGRTGLTPVGEERDAFLAARRAAIVAAVQRLFPTTASDTAPAAADS
ncbi:TetR family transcriptional regulator [Streptomyces aurantiogriseus]|uniref:TetR family transcriptional regulator n=1 Tax=Streptomyces aurantiogriseus TaxID=66870 RepID=A0A918KXV2_9ACTN|nr:TetR family transcriptional regulator [Streptomyces aurantiogriseus]GGR41506.1 TetR family transcriptional regulator [Streptomyces aurantiogriseus]